MARLKIFKGSIDLISGLRPKNNGDFPLMEAHDIVVDENGTRLDEKLENIASVEVDATLTQEGKAADAKTVGDLVGDIHAVLENI